MAVVSLTRVLKTLANHVVLLVTLVSLMLHLMSGMMTSGIELNAITLVNLIMSTSFSRRSREESGFLYLQKLPPSSQHRLCVSERQIALRCLFFCCKCRCF